MKVNSRLNGFSQGTLVLMADGTEKPIEKIKAGDKVLSFNQLDAFAPLEEKRVLDTASRVDHGVLEIIVDDVSLRVAPGQLFISPGHDWKSASSINEIIDRNGNVCKFEIKQIKTGKHAIYDIIVEDNHSLIANGVRVHNMLYSQADVVAGRYAPERSYEPKPKPEEVDGLDIFDLANGILGFKAVGRKKKKKKKSSRSTSYSRPDDIAVASKLLGSIGDLTDLLLDIINAATPADLNLLKLTAQSSIDNIVSYTQTYLASVLNVSTSTYDKSELYQWGLDIMQSAIDARKPFEETVVTASGKLTALNLLSLINLNVIRSTKKIKVYTTEDSRGELDIIAEGRRASSTKNRKLPGRNTYQQDHNGNGRFNQNENAGSRSSQGGVSSSGRFGSGAGSSTRSTSGSGKGSGGSLGGSFGSLAAGAAKGALGGAMSGGGAKGAAMGAISGALGSAKGGKK